MQIIVLGAGAIGSLYGAKLAAGNDVLLVGRPEHAAAISARGLRIEGIESQTVRVPAATAVTQIGANALVLLTTKVMASAAALEPIAPLVRDDTTILCLQNGLGSEQIARAAVGNRGVVLRGITQFGAIFETPGAIKYMAAGYTVIEQHERSDQIGEVLTAAGLNCHVSPNIAAEVWHKTVINCVVNPITAILGCDVGSIVQPGLDRLERLVIDECVAVALTQGIAFDDSDFMRQINERFAPSHNIASMLQDLRRGRPTEIDYMNGAVAALGAAHGVPCPVNRALTDIIEAMETPPRSLLPKEMLETQSPEARLGFLATRAAG
ncbi:MAG TPA: 2-dehydropantoate 2-reductase [Chthoniobacterales bacterium]|nr:2-dehydropantoate 2-reductase [Chthoniobacterales bacterium]